MTLHGGTSVELESVQEIGLEELLEDKTKIFIMGNGID